MLFKRKACLVVILTLCMIFNWTAVQADTVQTTLLLAKEDAVRLVLDTEKYELLPKHFRKTTDLTKLKGSNLKLTGLEKLNISGSSQFSGQNLSLLTKAIGTKLPITVFDLRQESHGFVNGMPISWESEKNNANMGLSRYQVLIKEVAQLKGIRLNSEIAFDNHPEQKVLVKKVENENILTVSQGLQYVRIPVTDNKLPTDDMVDLFVSFVNSLPKNSWLHFHCKEGIGRTTTFMCMFDAMHNWQLVTAQEIIDRQVALADFKLETADSFESEKRKVFIAHFVQYCKESNNFAISWSQWKTKNGLE